MKKLLLILLCLPMIGFSQGWIKSYGGIYQEFFNSVQQTSDGGYIALGFEVKNGTNPDALLVKTNANGDTIFTKTFGNQNYNEFGMTVRQTTDDGYIVAIQNDKNQINNQQSIPRINIIKTNQLGDIQWSNTVVTDTISICTDIKQTLDGGYIITGTTLSNTLLPAVLLIKTDSQGNQIWNYNYLSQVNSYAVTGHNVQQTFDDGYIITGYKVFANGVNGAMDNTFLIKTDALGGVIWTKIYSNTSERGGREVQQTSDSSFVIVGNKDFGGFLLIKTNLSGDSLWSKEYSNSFNGSSIKQTIDGGYIMCGSSLGDSVILIKTDGIGTLQWIKSYDGGSGKDVQKTTDGGYIIASENYYDAYLIKTDGNGNITSTLNIPIPNPNRKLQKIVDILGRDINPEKNKPFIEIYNDGTVEKKIIIE